MKRVKAAFDPHGLLNPGKIFPARRLISPTGRASPAIVRVRRLTQ